jgi:hypothetical protein
MCEDETPGGDMFKQEIIDIGTITHDVGGEGTGYIVRVCGIDDRAEIIRRSVNRKESV